MLRVFANCTGGKLGAGREGVFGGSFGGGDGACCCCCCCSPLREGRHVGSSVVGVLFQFTEISDGCMDRRMNVGCRDALGRIDFCGGNVRCSSRWKRMP